MNGIWSENNGSHRCILHFRYGGPAMTPKKVVQQLLEALPESCTYDDIKLHIELFEKIRKDQEAVMLGAKARLEIERYPEL